MGSFLIIIVVIDHKNATFGIPFSFLEIDSNTSIILLTRVLKISLTDCIFLVYENVPLVSVELLG